MIVRMRSIITTPRGWGWRLFTLPESKNNYVVCHCYWKRKKRKNSNSLTVVILFHPGKCQRQIYEVTGLTGTIESPGYPQNYSPNQTCIWRIVAKEGLRVHIHFDPRFYVTSTPSCRDDFVVISTRRQRFNDRRVVRNSRDSVVFCGNQKPSNVSSPANELWIRFKSKHGGHRGFRAWYSAEGELAKLFDDLKGNFHWLILQNCKICCGVAQRSYGKEGKKKTKENDSCKVDKSISEEQ